jgi:hypothetical protein
MVIHLIKSASPVFPKKDTNHHPLKPLLNQIVAVDPVPVLLIQALDVPLIEAIGQRQTVQRDPSIAAIVLQQAIGQNAVSPVIAINQPSVATIALNDRSIKNHAASKIDQNVVLTEVNDPNVPSTEAIGQCQTVQRDPSIVATALGQIVRNDRLNAKIVLQPEIAQNVVSPAMATNPPSTATNDPNAPLVIVNRHEIPSKDLDPKASVNAKKKQIHHFVNGIFRSLLVKFVSTNTSPIVVFAHGERPMT